MSRAALPGGGGGTACCSTQPLNGTYKDCGRGIGGDLEKIEDVDAEAVKLNERICEVVVDQFRW